MSNSARVTLTGSTWGHERGYGPLKKLNAQHPDLFPADVNWDVRTLQEFADQPMSELSKKYDLIVFDHPWIGEIAAKEYFYPLDDLLSKEYIDDQARNSVGPSHKSYIWGGKLYGIQIDAAGHVSAKRPDLLAKHGLTIPETWRETLSLAEELQSKRLPLITLSLDPVNIWCLYMTLAANKKFDPYTNGQTVLDRKDSAEILEFIIALAKFGPSSAFDWNPINVLDEMSSTNNLLYCPSLFGYSNYSVAGFRDHLVEFGHIPSAGFGHIGGIIGGAGIGITKSCKHPEVAAKVIEVLGSPTIQRTLYQTLGGQPGHRGAWVDKELNARTFNFFTNTLQNLDNGYLRPRFPGFIEIQTNCGDIMAEAVYGKTSVTKAVDGIDVMYRATLKKWADFQ